MVRRRRHSLDTSVRPIHTPPSTAHARGRSPPQVSAVPLTRAPKPRRPSSLGGAAVFDPPVVDKIEKSLPLLKWVGLRNSTYYSIPRIVFPIENRMLHTMSSYNDYIGRIWGSTTVPSFHELDVVRHICPLSITELIYHS